MYLYLWTEHNITIFDLFQIRIYFQIENFNGELQFENSYHKICVIQNSVSYFFVDER